MAARIQSTMDFSSRLRDYLASDPDDEVVEVSGVWHQRREIRSCAEQTLSLVENSGLPRDIGVGLVARNRVGHVAALIGLMAEQRPVVMLHAYQPPENLASDVRRLGLAVVIADEQDWASPPLASLTREGIVGLALSQSSVARPISDRQVGNLAKLRAPSAEIAVEMLTSGTTGEPKQAAISRQTFQRALDAAARMNTNAAGTADPAPHIQFYPLGNISGVWGVVPAAIAGRKIVLLEKFSLNEWLSVVRRHRPRQISLPPPAIHMILKSRVPAADLESVEIVRCGSGKLDPAIQSEFEREYEVVILTQYGATEFCGVTVGWTAADHARYAEAKRGSTGRAWPGVQLRVVDPETDEEVSSNSSGVLELQVSRVSDSWVRTNDIARVDSDGFVFIEGRADFVINRGGFKIAPEKVAEVLRRHRSVAEAVVVGAPDSRLNEVPIAGIELQPNSPPVREEELLQWVRDHLAPQSVPVHIFIFDQLPKTMSMKIHVARAREALLERWKASGLAV
jgi:long-chain acyl-CoA synthetase